MTPQIQAFLSFETRDEVKYVLYTEHCLIDDRHYGTSECIGRGIVVLKAKSQPRVESSRKKILSPSVTLVVEERGRSCMHRPADHAPLLLSILRGPKVAAFGNGLHLLLLSAEAFGHFSSAVKKGNTFFQ